MKLSADTDELSVQGIGDNKHTRDNKRITKDEAIVQMVDSNIHREHILPSEKAFCYKMN